VDEATIANIPISETARSRLHNPAQEPPKLSEDTMHSLRLFLKTLNAADDVYEGVREENVRTAEARGEDREILSLHEIERLLEDLTGVEPVVHDMCPEKSCAGFTGPFAEMDKCPYCGADRYKWVIEVQHGRRIRVRRGCKQFYTIPIGPALQAMFRTVEAARQARYRREATERMKAEFEEHGGVPVYHDYVDGSLYREYERLKRIRPQDIVVLISADGLQLLKMKKSDCWIYVWVILDLSPNVRFKKRYILPGGFVPGPEHIGNNASFLLPGLQNFNAISKEGLHLYDALDKAVFVSNPFLAFETADAIALAQMNQVNGHRGYLGCRLFCPHKGRRAMDDSHYYPACKCAHGPRVPGSDHPDYDPAHFPPPSSEDYDARLTRLLSARTPEELKDLRKETGMSAPTVFLGLSRMFPFPLCTCPDCMHLHGQNITTLFFGLWHGTLTHHKTDPPSAWPWRVLVGDTWKWFGAKLADARRYLPGSFERAPRNIAEKFTSGYKTWEFNVAFYGLGPGFLMDVLPQPYYGNYTKLVFSVRRKECREISAEQLRAAHRAQVEFHREYEEIYYQGMPERLGFCRQSIHNLSHGAPEVTRVGPLVLLAQWALERTIGDLGRQVRNFQGPKMYSNFAHIGWRQVQVNALYNIFPELAPSEVEISAADEDLGGGFALLRRGSDRTRRAVTRTESNAIMSFMREHDMDDVFPDAASVLVTRWGRLRLPNGQIVRSLWKEADSTDPSEIRMARNMKVSIR
jgi:hypothetical protein